LVDGRSSLAFFAISGSAANGSGSDANGSGLVDVADGFASGKRTGCRVLEPVGLDAWGRQAGARVKPWTCYFEIGRDKAQCHDRFAAIGITADSNDWQSLLICHPHNGA
jgi:hypothetical protein